METLGHPRPSSCHHRLVLRVGRVHVFTDGHSLALVGAGGLCNAWVVHSFSAAGSAVDAMAMGGRGSGVHLDLH